MDCSKELTGMTVVVTGATSGMGRAMAMNMAQRGAHVIGVGRSQSRCAELKRDVLKADPAARITVLVADLASQSQVLLLAEDIRGAALRPSGLVGWVGDGRIDALVNNAASVYNWYATTEDGYEAQFAVNHLAPFVLTHELLPLLELSPTGRVISISSASHFGATMHWPDVMYRKHYSCLMAYKQSKLANVLFVMELNRRLAQHSHVRAYAVDPGLVNTEIGQKGTSGIENWVWRKRRTTGVSPEQGAATALFLATTPALAQADAAYWKDSHPAQPSKAAQDSVEAARLWAYSERLCGMTWGAGSACCQQGDPMGSPLRGG